MARETTGAAPDRISPAFKLRSRSWRSRTASRSIKSWPRKSAARRVSLHSNSAWMTPAKRVTAIPAIPAPTPTISAGAAGRCPYPNSLPGPRGAQPLPPPLAPRLLFERLCGAGQPMTPAERARQSKYRRSILDFVTEDTRKLESHLGPTDRRKLDEYLSAIREVERQIQRAETDNRQIDPPMDKPYGIPADFAEHFSLMSSMIAIAFQADLTRIVTFLVTGEGTSRPYRELGLSDGQPPPTHHRNQPDLMEKVRKINEYQVQQFAGFVEKMKAAKEGD